MGRRDSRHRTHLMNCVCWRNEMDESSSEGRCMFPKVISYGYDSHRIIMIQRLLDTKEGRKSSTCLTYSSTGRIYGNRWISICGILMTANEPKYWDTQHFQFFAICRYWRYPGKTFHFDFVVGLPVCREFDAIWVVMNRLSKM